MNGIFCFKKTLYLKVFRFCVFHGLQTSKFMTSSYALLHVRKYGTKYSRMDLVKFVEDSPQKILHAPFLSFFFHMFLVVSFECY